VSLSVRSDSSDTYWKIAGAPPAEGLGAVLEQYAVRAAVKSDEVQDGGAVTSLLSALLAAGEIDGALVSKPSDDPTNRGRVWRPSPQRRSSSRRRRAASTTRRWRWPSWTSRAISSAHPEIAVVGTPCEIQGIRAMQARRWATGAHRIDAVVLTIALLCTKSFDYEG